MPAKPLNNSEKGKPWGVACSEAAIYAAVGGALDSSSNTGIPGSASTAV